MNRYVSILRGINVSGQKIIKMTELKVLYEQLKTIINNFPFVHVNLPEDGTKILVTFLSNIHLEDKVANLQKYVIVPEKLVVKNKEVYLHCPNGYGKSKLSNTFIEKKLNVNATTRNWKSVNKLYELSKQ